MSRADLISDDNCDLDVPFVGAAISGVAATLRFAFFSGLAFVVFDFGMIFTVTLDGKSYKHSERSGGVITAA